MQSKTSQIHFNEVKDGFTLVIHFHAGTGYDKIPNRQMRMPFQKTAQKMILFTKDQVDHMLVKPAKGFSQSAWGGMTPVAKIQHHVDDRLHDESARNKYSYWSILKKEK